MGRSYRKRSADDDAEAAVLEPVASDEQMRVRLEDTRRLQQERVRVRGVETARLAGLTADSLAAGSVLHAAEGEEEDEGMKLRDTFSAEQQREVGTEDPHLLKYLEAELAKRRGVAAVAAPSASTLREASLYETPEELRAPGAQGGAQDNADRWLTGIQEVQLPVEYQLRNIEDTERAKAQLLDAQRARAGGGGGAQADGTFLQPQQAARAEGNVSTDDIVARRFMQAEKRRQRR